MQKLSPFEVSEICDELGEAYPKNIKPVPVSYTHLTLPTSVPV